MPPITKRDGHYWIDASNSQGELGQYKLSDETTYRDTPEEGTNYFRESNNGIVSGFKKGSYRTITPYFEKYATGPEYVVTPENSASIPQISDIKLNTEANIPDISNYKFLNLGETASENNFIQDAQSRYETSDINKEKADEFVRNNYGWDSWGKQVGIPLAIGAGAALGAGYAAPWLFGAYGSELMGGANLYGGYHGLKNLIGENGISKTIRKWNDKDYEGFGWSLLGDTFDATTSVLPFYSGVSKFSHLLNNLDYTSDASKFIQIQGYRSPFFATDPLIRNPNKLAKTFTPEEILEQGKARIRKIYNDSEYREKLAREFGYEVNSPEVNKMVDDLINNMNSQKFNPTPITSGELGQNSVTSLQTKLNGENVRIFDSDGVDFYENLGKKLNENYKNILSNPKQDFRLSNLYLDLLKNPKTNSRAIQERIRQTAAHEAAHASKFGSIGDLDINLESTSRKIAEHNANYPVRTAPDKHLERSVNYYKKLGKNTTVEDMKKYAEYILTPDELRVRALQLERLHQTTGKGYKDLLNDPKIVNSNPNFLELKMYLNQDDLLQYLEHFAQNEFIDPIDDFNFSDVNDFSYT